jgi:hypothetical protein
MSLLFGSKNTSLTSFDLFDKSFQNVSTTFLQSLFGYNRVNFVAGDSMETLPTYAYEVSKNQEGFPRCQLYAVDGGHSYEVAMSDLVNFHSMTECENILLMDDVFWKNAESWGTTHVDGVKQAWKEALFEQKIVKQYGCYEYYDESPAVFIDEGVWQGWTMVPRAFCVGTFVKPNCPRETVDKVRSTVEKILSSMDLRPCERGCCYSYMNPHYKTALMDEVGSLRYSQEVDNEGTPIEPALSIY